MNMAILMQKPLNPDLRRVNNSSRDLAQASSYRTDKVTYSAIHIISVMRQPMTKVNFIYRNCIQLRWIPAVLLANIQSDRRYPGSDTVSNRFYIATHRKFRIVINQAQNYCPRSALYVSWFQRRWRPCPLAGRHLHSPALESNDYSNAPC